MGEKECFHDYQIEKLESKVKNLSIAIDRETKYLNKVILGNFKYNIVLTLFCFIVLFFLLHK